MLIFMQKMDIKREKIKMQERESKFIENIVNTILSKDESKKYFIHRTAIPPVFYDDSINTKWLKQVQESWIESNIVSSDSFTILKLDEESYNVAIVPSTNSHN